MAFIKTIDEADAKGRVKDFYDLSRQRMNEIGDLAHDQQAINSNVFKAHSLKPEWGEAWDRFSFDVAFGKSSLGRRREQMIGVLISSLLKCGYATIWHGLIMGEAIGNQANNDEAVAIKQDFRSAGLEPDDEALMEYCEKVTLWPHTATQADVDNLRAHGFTDSQVLEIAILIGFWNWVPRVLLALGVAEDDYTKDHGHPETREALAKGMVVY